MKRLQYLDYGHYRDRCRHVVLSDRAYASIVSEAIKSGKNETGGVFLGVIYKSVWYIVECVDSGMATTNTRDYFQWDADYVNHLLEKYSMIYLFMVSGLGFWHLHPGSMDFFSMTDEIAIRSNLGNSRYGLLSMLVNKDPKLRMTFYYCWGETMTRVKYDVGDEYFPAELLEYASPGKISEKMGIPESKRVEVLYNRVYPPDAFPKTVMPDQKARSSAASASPSPSAGILTAQAENYRSTIAELQKINSGLRNQRTDLLKRLQILQEESALLRSEIAKLRDEQKESPASCKEEEVEITAFREEIDGEDTQPEEGLTAAAEKQTEDAARGLDHTEEAAAAEETHAEENCAETVSEQFVYEDSEPGFGKALAAAEEKAEEPVPASEEEKAEEPAPSSAEEEAEEPAPSSAEEEAEEPAPASAEEEADLNTDKESGQGD